MGGGDSRCHCEPAARLCTDGLRDHEATCRPLSGFCRPRCCVCLHANAVGRSAGVLAWESRYAPLRKLSDEWMIHSRGHDGSLNSHLVGPRWSRISCRVSWACKNTCAVSRGVGGGCSGEKLEPVRRVRSARAPALPARTWRTATDTRSWLLPLRRFKYQRARGLALRRTPWVGEACGRIRVAACLRPPPPLRPQPPLGRPATPRAATTPTVLETLPPFSFLLSAPRASPFCSISGWPW